MIAGALEIQLTADVARLQADMAKVTSIVSRSAKQMEDSLAGVKQGFKAIAAAFTVDKIKDYINSTIEAADKMNDLRTRTGLTGQELLVLQGAAVRGGQSLESISDVASKLSKRFGAAEIGTGETARALQAMGMSATDSTGKLKSVSEILRESGERFAEYEDGANKASLATALFGKGGDKFIPVIEGIKETEERFKRLGITIDEDVITASDKFKDSMADVHALNEVFARQLVAELLPYLQKFVEWLIELKAKGNETQSSLHLMISVAKVLTSTFYFLYTAVASVAEIFVAAGMSAYQLAHGNFSEAAEVLASGWERAKKRATDYVAFVQGLGIGGMPQGIEKATQWEIMDREDRARNRKRAPSLPDPKAAAEAAKIAKAQLALDLEVIKKRAELEINSFNNQQRIIDAQHAAGLIEEQAYYEERKRTLKLVSDAAEDALVEEIERMKKERLVGAERLENEKKIEDARAALTRRIEDRRNQEQVLSIEQTAALVKVAQAYLQTKQAAEEYLTVLQRAQNLQLAGYGAGNQERDRASARAQIEDQFTAKRRALDDEKARKEIAGPLGPEAMADYNKALALINDYQQKSLASFDVYYAARLQKEADWSVGAMEAMRNYADESRNVARQTEQLFTNAFKGMEDALVEFVKTGKLDFKKLADSIISDLIRIQIRAAMTKMMGDGGGLGGIFEKLFGLGGKVGNAGGGIEGLTSESADAFSAMNMAANGADWMVGGSGGTDSKIAQFRVTPGESIHVRTPEQRDSGGGGDVYVDISIPVNAPGADIGTVARLEAVVARMPREIVPKVIDAVRRGGSARSFIKG